MTLLELAERVEKATGPDRELDAYIRAAIEDRDVRIDEHNAVLGRSRRAPYDECLLGWIDPGKVRRNFSAAFSKPPLPAYTSSLDAAMTLIPEGWTVARIAQDDGKCWWVELREGFATSYSRVIITPSYREQPPVRGCRSAALALTSACLRARHGQQS